MPFLHSYLTTLGRNLIFAYPLQLFLMGPLVRFVFTRFVKTKGGRAAA